MFKPIPVKLNQLSGKIVHGAYEVHVAIGPGLLETVYELCLQQELLALGLKVGRQLPVPFEYKGTKFSEAYRLDLLVDDQIIVEIKSVETLLPIHKAQMITYLKLMDKRLGLLINFNVPVIKQGIQRVVV